MFLYYGYSLAVFPSFVIDNEQKRKQNTKNKSEIIHSRDEYHIYATSGFSRRKYP
ncbi:hypothetical protein CSB69_0257 [Morganella morganii]|nr:hypothetical protein CSB69_0257 [Morganella morganii]